MNPQMKQLFDSLQDAVVIVDGEGVVRHANQAGTEMFAVQLGQPFPNPAVVRGVLDVVSGFKKSPAGIPLPVAPGAPPSMAKVLTLPLPGLYAVTGNDTAPRAFYDQTLANFHEYLRIDLAEPMLRFSRQASQLASGPAAAAFAELAADAKLIAERLQRIEQLAELFGGAPLVDQERLSFREIIDEALGAVAPTLATRGIDAYFDGLDGELPPVYGSRVWLTRALRELLDNVVRHAVSRSKLEISLRCTGNHVIISLRNHGQLVSNHLKSKQLYVPFAGTPGANGQKKPSGPGRRVAGLGLPIVQQIMRLHGGFLNIVEGGEDGLLEFNLELATGAPARDSQALDIEQAKRYARDLATLAGRMRPAPRPVTNPAAAGGALPG